MSSLLVLSSIHELEVDELDAFFLGDLHDVVGGLALVERVLAAHRAAPLEGGGRRERTGGLPDCPARQREGGGKAAGEGRQEGRAEELKKEERSATTPSETWFFI